MNEILKNQDYRVLARKYRPQFFFNLIGQETLVQTLTNSIKNNRVAHAYLLTGVRGVGKTTTARLIAMSLNCEQRKNDSCEPCGKCETCISIRQDRNIDVIEMDAASKTGVDDVRDIIENIKYKPVHCNYKIFIIDEVHMLSKNAFNALLKTLEEPPTHVKFIFATTEIKKIPITIISRCQRFDLLRIESNVLSKHLLDISQKENIKIDNDALALIVRASDGSVRDGLSLLDQAISNNEEIISANSIILMLGLADRITIFELMDSIFNADTPKALSIFNNIHKSGADVINIFDEMLKVTHFLTQIKIFPGIKDDIHIPEFERKKGLEISEKISMSSLGIVWQVLFKGFEDLQTGINLYQNGEMLIIRLIYLYEGPHPDKLIKDIEINKENKNYDFKNAAIKSESNEKSTINQNMSTVLSIKSFRQLVDLFYQKKEAMLHTYLYNNVKLISFKEGEVVINAEDVKDSKFSRTIAVFVSKWTGRIWQVSSSSSNIGKTLHEEDLLNQQKEIEIMQNDKEIKNILIKYPGIKIHSINEVFETSDEKSLVEDIQKTKEK